MDRDPPNPYIDLNLSDLDAAMSRRAGELLSDTRVGRRDTAYLLIASARRIAPMTAFPNSPARLVREGQTVVDPYMDEFEAHARTLRYWILKHAQDAAKVVEPFSSDECGALTRAGTVAQESDAGLRTALEIIERLRRAREAAAKPPRDARSTDAPGHPESPA